MKVLRWLRDRIYDPVLMTRFHAGSLLLWSVLTPVTVLTPLKNSVPWISFMSVWALSTGAWAALQAAHGEREQDRLLGEIRQQLDREHERLCEMVGVLADEVLALRQALHSGESPVSN